MVVKNAYNKKVGGMLEKPARLSREQLAVILDGVADGIIALDAEMRLVFANQAAAIMLGFNSKEELFEIPIEEVLRKFNIQNEWGEPFPFDRLPIRLVFQGAEKPSAVVRFKSLETNQESWSLVKARPIVDADGRVDMAVSVFHDISRLKRSEQSQIFLAEVGKVLSSSLDYSVTLKSVSDLAIKYLADWCVIDVLEDDGSLNQIAVSHTDPALLEYALELQNRFPRNWNANSGIPNVLRTGRAEFYPEISEAFIEEANLDQEQLEIFRKFGVKSAMILPMVARGHTLGVITLLWAGSGERYTRVDVVLAEELARRAAISIDNRRLYMEVQTINSELETRVTKRTEQLHSLISALRSEISEREKAEAGLQESETIFSSLFESAPDGHILVNANGTITRLNAQAEALFGYEREELLGKPVEILLPHRFHSRHVQHRLAYLAEQRLRPMGVDLELFARRKDGSEFQVDIMLSPVQTERENLVIAAIRDISERKQMEAELDEVRRRLIENVEAERLSLAQELHDDPIQNLYGIAYNLKALEAGLTTNIIDPSVQEALNSSQEIVQEVLSSLRSISGQLRPPTLAAYGLKSAIQGHMEMVIQTHPELEIEVDLAEDDQMLPERVRLTLYRICQHAVSNVIRHAQARRLSVRLRIDAENVILEIEDDGCGFNLPAHWVFLAREGHFGLAGTYERVKAIGGDLKINSALGKGTLIQVTFPLDQLED
jgi:PAS domain S-box-containing protein